MKYAEHLTPLVKEGYPDAADKEAVDGDPDERVDDTESSAKLSLRYMCSVSDRCDCRESEENGVVQAPCFAYNFLLVSVLLALDRLSQSIIHD